MQNNDPAFQSQQHTEQLIHRVFAQSDAGAELLGKLRENLVLSPGDRLGTDLYALGKEEGRKEFIRNIILTINKIESDT